jgi:hypothetical protein
VPPGGLADSIRPGVISYLAFDVDEPYGAVFSVWLSDDGEAALNAECFRLTERGRWQQMTSGGHRVGGWPVPPAPPRSFEGVAVLGSVGCDVETADGAEVAVDVVSGFVGTPALPVRVTRDGHSRIVQPSAGTGAFVAVSVGVDLVAVAAVDSLGSSADPGHRAGHIPWQRLAE